MLEYSVHKYSIFEKRKKLLKNIIELWRLSVEYKNLFIKLILAFANKSRDIQQ
jgi:hypothetical protein